uniref:Retrotransposon gag domain-containing protein n=1 Tax=Quercus lobata TaxID=97700 RepID=A0A7N2MU35_QUELO
MGQPCKASYTAVLVVGYGSNDISGGYANYLLNSIRSGETHSSVATNEALASLRSTLDHHTKDTQEMCTIQEIHTRTLNEMNQQLATLLQRLDASDQGGPQSPSVAETCNASSSIMPLSHPVRLEFQRFCGEDPASWDSEETGVFADWESLVQALHIRFGSTAYDDPMEILTRLRQTTSVSLCKAQFEVLSNKIKGFSSSHKLSCFLSGLKDEMKLPMRMLNPQSLNEAFGLSKIQEEYIWSCKRNSRMQIEQGKPSILGLLKALALLDPKTKLPIKRISPAQMEERKKKGLCYSCDEKWVPGHKYKNDMLFLLDYAEVLEVKVANGDVIKTCDQDLRKTSAFTRLKECKITATRWEAVLEGNS